MEELGKYQSIQDRIKRLSKNQNQTTAIAINEQQPSYMTKFKDTEDSRKQNIPQFTLSKKRQSATTDYKTLLASLSPKASNESRFQSMGYGLPELSQEDYKEPAPVLRKSESEYMLKNSMRLNRDSRKTPRDIPNLTKRNESFEDITAMLNQKYPSRMYTTELYEPTEPQDKSYGYSYEIESMTKRRESTLDSKKTNLNSLTNRQGFTQIDNYLLDKYKADLGEIKLDDNLDAKKTMASTGDDFGGRMLKKCRSGTFERVPGKIVRNK